MKNLGEKIDVGFGGRADDGTKLEPEEQGVRRTIFTDADAKHGDDSVGQMRASIVAEMSAIEAAELISKPCHLCAHWRPDEWPRLRRKMETTPEGVADLNRVRAALLSMGGATIPQLQNNDDFHDVEHALGAAGVCKALTDLYQQNMVTMPTACCPDSGPDGLPLPSLFVARRGDERRTSISTRDHILRLASKKLR